MASPVQSTGFLEKVKGGAAAVVKYPKKLFTNMTLKKGSIIAAALLAIVGLIVVIFNLEIAIGSGGYIARRERTNNE